MKRIVSALCVSIASLLSTPLSAQDLGEALEINVLPGWQRADGKHIAALQITLGDGWKTYWRSPGDAGIPPRFDWAGSGNLSDIAVKWPTPKQMAQDNVKIIGYTDTLTLPLALTPAKSGKAITLVGTVNIGVCKEVCLPISLDVSQDLPLGKTKPDPRIIAALADRPYSASEAKVSRVACHISPMTDGLSLRAEIDLPSTGGPEIAVIETDNPAIWVAQAKTKRQGGRIIAQTEMFHIEGHAFALNRSGLRLTVLGQDYAVDISGCPAG